MPPGHVAWSASRVRLLEQCERAYYWRYLGARGGYKAPLGAESRRAWTLKHLTALPLLTGTAVHTAARELLIANRDRQMVPTAEQALAGVDRVDALLCYHDAVDNGHVAALLSPARLLLGHVLRDADVLLKWLKQIEERDGHTRRALVVGLGLLGVVPESAVALPYQRSRADWAAYILAISRRSLTRPVSSSA
jgi:hypothetical protein